MVQALLSYGMVGTFLVGYGLRSFGSKWISYLVLVFCCYRPRLWLPLHYLLWRWIFLRILFLIPKRILIDTKAGSGWYQKLISRGVCWSSLMGWNSMLTSIVLMMNYLVVWRRNILIWDFEAVTLGACYMILSWVVRPALRTTYVIELHWQVPECGLVHQSVYLRQDAWVLHVLSSFVDTPQKHRWDARTWWTALALPDWDVVSRFVGPNTNWC